MWHRIYRQYIISYHIYFGIRDYLIIRIFVQILNTYLTRMDIDIILSLWVELCLSRIS